MCLEHRGCVEASLRVFAEIVKKSNSQKEFEKNVVEVSQRLFLEALENGFSTPEAVVTAVTFAMEMKELAHATIGITTEKEKKHGSQHSDLS